MWWHLWKEFSSCWSILVGTLNIYIYIYKM
jgi:hypothetical protein